MQFVTVLTPDWALGVFRNAKDPAAAQVAGFMPEDLNVTPDLPQIQEVHDFGPAIFEMGPPGTDFLDRAERAGMDFVTGTYIREALLSGDLKAALDDLNTRWAQAAQ